MRRGTEAKNRRRMAAIERMKRHFSPINIQQARSMIYRGEAPSGKPSSGAADRQNRHAFVAIRTSENAGKGGKI